MKDSIMSINQVFSVLNWLNLKWLKGLLHWIVPAIRGGLGTNFYVQKESKLLRLKQFKWRAL